MTVIVCRDGVMAADSAVWAGDIFSGHDRKITRLADGRLVGSAGWRPEIERFLRWLGGSEAKPPPVGDCDFAALILARCGIWRVNHKFDLYRHIGGWAVEGAHDEFLLGALAAGASAAEAVRLAIIYCRRAGGEVQVERL
jgi:hypothetical protein